MTNKLLTKKKVRLSPRAAAPGSFPKPFTGNVWFHNRKRGKCDDCMETTELFHGFMIAGKLKTKQCHNCFASHNHKP